MSRECMVFYSDFDDFAAWRRALEAVLPDVDLLRAEDVPDPTSVRYALVWKPPQDFFAAYSNLQLVTILGAGADSLVGRTDLPDTPIARLSDPKMARMMAGFVLFAVLRHARDIPDFERAQRARTWRYIHPRGADEIRVGVLGLGELGATAAQECARQGFQVGGWSRSLKSVEGVRCVSGMDELPRFLSEADILVCMLPLTPDTERLLNAERLAMLPHGAAFVNVSRGRIVDEAALVAALRERRIRDATLDVFENEPLLPDSPFYDLDNVLITPHLASIALPASAARQIADNVRRLRSGEDIESRVDISRGY